MIHACNVFCTVGQLSRRRFLACRLSTYRTDISTIYPHKTLDLYFAFHIRVAAAIVGERSQLYADDFELFLSSS